MPPRKKRSISLPPDLDAQIADAAANEGMTYSSWIADTARREFTIRAGMAAVAQYEHDHGVFTAEELSEAEAWAEQAASRSRRSGTNNQQRSA